MTVELAHLAQADRQRAEVVERRLRGRVGGQLGDVALLAVQQLGELAQRRLVEQRVEVRRGGCAAAAISAGLSSP